MRAPRMSTAVNLMAIMTFLPFAFYVIALAVL